MTEPSKGSHSSADAKAGSKPPVKEQPPVKDAAPVEPEASDAATTDEPEDDALRFPISQLIAESRSLLRVSRHVAIGALHGEERKTLTQEQAKERVEAFRKRPAQAPPEEES